MAYIQILAIVLCSCFVQDAFSVAKVVRKPVAAATTNDVAAPQFPDANDQAATMRPVRRMTTIKRTVSRKPTAVQAPPPPPPPKYPYLTAVKDMFWNTWEDINRNDVGKLSTRALRNMLGSVLVDDLFWSSASSAVRRRAKVTNDSQRADHKIRMCNALTSTLTSPNAMQGFKEVVNEVYGTVSRIRSDVGTDALRLAIEIVNGGEVTNGLNMLTNIVTNIRLNPEMLNKGFNMFQRTLNLGGMLNMSGGMAKGLMSITSKFNK
ncbi:uncharacterized protein LOC113552996 [Rhopalosiphum maidis]|uniref:uncharacterized protein LOC113552996 n=1 Tax=Rhopalosiphum maidis TaxID=43146 RepID=UPI000EFE1796|nr:uncharacterized protein LOC113552996 [Rhopalosiphum maidis]